MSSKNTSLIILFMLASFSLHSIANVKNKQALLPLKQKAVLQKFPRPILMMQPGFQNVQKAPQALPGTLYAYPDVQPLGWSNYMSFNWKVNNITEVGHDYIFAPLDSVITYYDMTSGTANSYHWTGFGTDPITAESQDFDAIYTQEGRYEFPILKTSNNAGDSTYQRKHTLKAGGKAEIALFNSYSLGGSYRPTFYGWTGKGFCGGSNTQGIDAYGNLYFIGQDSAFVESVSVYIRPNPTASKPQNLVKLSVYGVGTDSEGFFTPNKYLIGASTLRVRDMKPTASEVTGIKYSNGKEAIGMAEFKFSSPVKVPGAFFITVENLGNNIAGGDTLVIAMNDLDPIAVDSFKTVAGNPSWIRYNSSWESASVMFFNNTTQKYTLNGVFMINPVVNYKPVVSGIETNYHNNELYFTRVKNGFKLLNTNLNGELLRVFTIDGKSVRSVKISSSSTNVIDLLPGAYIVRIGTKSTKLIVN